VTASPKCATLISVTSRYLLYVCIDTSVCVNWRLRIFGFFGVRGLPS
jgi:hypothetical protein